MITLIEGIREEQHLCSQTNTEPKPVMEYLTRRLEDQII